MLYLCSFNRFILISLALLGLSVSSVHAALINFDLTGGVPDPYRNGPQFLDRWLRSYFPVHQTASGSLMDS